MFAGFSGLQHSEPIAPLAEAVADAFERLGDRRAAAEVLALAVRHGTNPSLALRLGERALEQGDAAAALDAMVPAWEAGFEDTRLESLLALSSLALGLYDVVDALTEVPEKSAEHLLIRWVLYCWEGREMAPPAWTRAETVWSLRTVLQQLAKCGRTDLVYCVRQALAETMSPRLERALDAIPSSPPPPCKPFAPPLDGRDAFRAGWRLPAADACFSWAWACAREVLEGERVLLVCPDPEPLLPLFAHARVDVVSNREGEGVDHVAGPEALPIGPGRYEHVVAFFWLEGALDPGHAMRNLARALTHEGQLHLLTAGPSAVGDFDLVMSASTVERLCKRSGLQVDGVATRDEMGATVVPEEAAVQLLRGQKLIV